MSRRRALRIAMIGQRGVPATWGGIEHHVEQLGSRLAALGHEVTVFARPRYVAKGVTEYRGMKVRTLPCPPGAGWEAFGHSALCSMATLNQHYDVVHYHAVGPGLVCWVPKWFSRSKVVLTVHGLDADRAKWGGLAKRALSTGTWMSARVPDATVVVSQALAEHYRTHYGRETSWITNGVLPGRHVEAGAYLASLGLTRRRYALFVGRFVPEKAPDLLLSAFARLGVDSRLVLAGGSSHTDEFAGTLGRMAEQDPRVVLPGYVYGEDLQELYSNAGLFVLPSDVEGLPLTLLEAISYGLPVVASDIAPHREVLGEGQQGHRIFRAGDTDDLERTLSDALLDPEGEALAGSTLAPDVLKRHDWDDIADRTAALYQRLAGLTPTTIDLTAPGRHAERRNALGKEPVERA
ncbi:MAG: glycosyltransferase family 4 protein [Kineosporiaceae bacterium]